MKKSLFVLLAFACLAYGSVTTNHATQGIIHQSTETLIKSITMQPAYAAPNGKTYTSTVPVFKIKTICPQEDYDEILMDAYLNGHILLQKSIPLGDFRWIDWADSVAFFVFEESDDWHYFLKTEEVNEIYFIITCKEQTQTSVHLQFFVDESVPIVQCYDEDGDLLLGTHASQSHEVDLFATLRDPESGINLDDCELKICDPSRRFCQTLPGYSFQIIDETPEGYIIKNSVNFEDFSDQILSEIENIEGNSIQIAPKVWISLHVVNKAGRSTLHQCEVSFDLLDPKIELTSFAGITTEPGLYTPQESNNISFALEISDPEQGPINNHLVWSPASGINLASFQLYVNDYLTNLTITDLKPIIEFSPLPLGLHTITAIIADHAGRSSTLAFQVRSNCCVELDEDNHYPEKFSLSQSFPNPFNPATTLRYTLAKESHVVLTIYNNAGQKIDELVNEQQSAGYYSLNWNASAYPSGVYLYHISAGEFTDTKKCILLK
ncbi:MAG: T9SS type A sorting domain-containing protein [Candidatus Marinimicrobia bacterium]|nr:T9SS type A sorting domain-containing protein [Candidatus Neomarinimicrobiota bacterium]